MTQYLADIKSKVDLIATYGLPICTEDFIIYTLNRLPHLYQSFKIVIRTNLQPLNSDDLYSLLCNEETLQLVEFVCQDSGNQTALVVGR